MNENRKNFFCTNSYKKHLFVAIAVLGLTSCKKHKQVFISKCNDGITFRHMAFNHLLDSIAFFDKQYVEVSGNYREGKGQSALFNDSLFVSHANSNAIWVNFSQDCPLYLEGTRTGLFEYNDGKFTLLNNRKMTIRGIIDIKAKGHSHSYKASINKVSYIAF